MQHVLKDNSNWKSLRFSSYRRYEIIIQTNGTAGNVLSAAVAFDRMTISRVKWNAVPVSSPVRIPVRVKHARWLLHRVLHAGALTWNNYRAISKCNWIRMNYQCTSKFHSLPPLPLPRCIPFDPIGSREDRQTRASWKFYKSAFRESFCRDSIDQWRWICANQFRHKRIKLVTIVRLTKINKEGGTGTHKTFIIYIYLSVKFRLRHNWLYTTNVVINFKQFYTFITNKKSYIHVCEIFYFETSLFFLCCVSTFRLFPSFFLSFLYQHACRYIKKDNKDARELYTRGIYWDYKAKKKSFFLIYNVWNF